jgi:hypothetical protein
MDDWSLLPRRNAVREPAPNDQRPLTKPTLDTSRPFMDDTGGLIGEAFAPAVVQRAIATSIGANNASITDANGKPFDYPERHGTFAEHQLPLRGLARHHHQSW